MVTLRTKRHFSLKYDHRRAIGGARDSRAAMMLSVPASPGDVLDRITILGIKRARITTSGLANVEAELAALHSAWAAASDPNAGLGAPLAAPVLPTPESVPEYDELSRVNEALWEVEDRLRIAEAREDFGPGFVADARSVYRLNDRRAALKRAVNLRFGSAILEEKIHPSY